MIYIEAYLMTISKKLEISDSASPFKPNWINLLFFVPAYLVAIFGYPLYLYFGGEPSWKEFAFAFVFYALGAMGITVGYHRAFSHRSFQMSPIFKWMALLLGSSSGEGSAISWCSDHRRHHKYEDTDKDPYNVKRSFWWAHMGWILGAPATSDFSNCPDLQKDPLLRHNHKYYWLWLTVTAGLIPLGIGFLVGRPLAFLLLGGFTRLFVVNQATFLINSYAHYFGRRPFSTKLTAKDSLFCSVLAWGEGWHNYHHRFPFDYRNGHKIYHWDPSKWVIASASYFGLASNLKRTPACEIYRARLQVQSENVVIPSPAYQKLEETVQTALKNWRQLSLEWETKKQDMSRLSQGQMTQLKQKLRVAKKEFQQAYASWRAVLKTAKSRV